MATENQSADVRLQASASAAVIKNKATEAAREQLFVVPESQRIDSRAARSSSTGAGPSKTPQLKPDRCRAPAVMAMQLRGVAEQISAVCALIDQDESEQALENEWPTDPLDPSCRLDDDLLTLLSALRIQATTMADRVAVAAGTELRALELWQQSRAIHSHARLMASNCLQAELTPKQFGAKSAGDANPLCRVLENLAYVESMCRAIATEAFAIHPHDPAWFPERQELL